MTKKKPPEFKLYKFVVSKSEVAAASLVFSLTPKQVEEYSTNAGAVTAKLFNAWNRM